MQPTSQRRQLLAAQEIYPIMRATKGGTTRSDIAKLFRVSKCCRWAGPRNLLNSF